MGASSFETRRREHRCPPSGVGIMRTTRTSNLGASSHAELYAKGKNLREKCPRRSHAAWTPAHGRADPLHQLEESAKDRIPELIPLRNGRMVQSPFTFYRGTALNMAADLATTPASGPRVQAC